VKDIFAAKMRRQSIAPFVRKCTIYKKKHNRWWFPIKTKRATIEITSFSSFYFSANTLHMQAG